MQNNNKPKLIRITTVPMALRYLLQGQMNYMSTSGYDVIMISAEGKELTEVLRQEKCRHLIVPMTRKITPFQDLKCLFQLIKIFIKEKPDIVHSHTPKAGLLGMLAARICGVKTRIHTVAGLPLMVEHGAKFTLLKYIEKLTYWCASTIWPNSPSLKKYILEQKLTRPEKINIIGKGSSNGINLQRYNPQILDNHKLAEIKKCIHYNSSFTYLLFTGRLVKDKGIIELMDAFAHLQKSHSRLKLLLLGDFENGLDPLPRQTMDCIQHNPDVIHVSWTNDVEYYMQLADTFVFPSHREGFPNVLLQAGAMKLPIICSSICGNIDIVQNNQTGLLFNTHNVQNLAEKIEYSIFKKEEMGRMASQLHKYIHRELKTTQVWEKILMEYSQLQTQEEKIPAKISPAHRDMVPGWMYHLWIPGYNKQNAVS